MYQRRAALSIKKLLEIAIVLMSDGPSEMFNHEGEILDYPAARNFFAEVADQIVILSASDESVAKKIPRRDIATHGNSCLRRSRTNPCRNRKGRKLFLLIFSGRHLH